MESRGKMATRDICYIAVSVALIAVCSWLSFRVEPLAYTFQLLAVLFCAGLLGWWRALIAVAAYVLLGLVGVPVFAGFTSGIMAPTRGYVIGFLFTVVIVGLAYKIDFKNENAKVAFVLNLIVRAAAMVLGVAVCYAFGTGWFILYMSSVQSAAYTVWEALGLCVIPYLWFDAVKIVVALILVEALKKAVNVRA